ncbi:hypothetical protein [Streptomyces syringium]|uniref:Uncharacterized protein n=1 Tax=Streptomyces syringium TaxID=76729 RepID=A0ABS4XW90_9ACTN|nr:hypothetical protein [Streptomyces syringium]MBP2400762.1 hypothetical protein [Streptomyces syringium]
MQHPRPAQDVAGDLRAAVLVPPGRPVVLALTRQRRDVDRHLLDGVQALQDQGIAGLTVIPHNEGLQRRIVEPGAGPLPMRMLAIGWELAAAVHQAQPSRR